MLTHFMQSISLRLTLRLPRHIALMQPRSADCSSRKTWRWSVFSRRIRHISSSERRTVAREAFLHRSQDLPLRDTKGSFLMTSPYPGSVPHPTMTDYCWAIPPGECAVRRTHECILLHSIGHLRHTSFV